jgi:hypothetical protein
MHFIMPGLFVEMGLANILSMLAWNCNLPDLYLGSSWDYRHEHLAPKMSLYEYQHIKTKRSVPNKLATAR